MSKPLGRSGLPDADADAGADALRVGVDLRQADLDRHAHELGLKRERAAERDVVELREQHVAERAGERLDQHADGEVEHELDQLHVGAEHLDLRLADLHLGVTDLQDQHAFGVDDGLSKRGDDDLVEADTHGR